MRFFFLFNLGLLNLRGSDIDNNPVFFAYVILTQTEIQLYVLNEKRITENVKKHFEEERINVKIKKYGNILDGVVSVVCNLAKIIIMVKYVEIIILLQ